ncbi:hypothetical protein HUB98_06320 [Paenibacillus barcinonensis]|uniref:Uncharacterized protein n=1 Tax=Paenibacillus barcinonensis TaxID=198119 RepID=A0A2V4VDH9_PAEBA|nr:hypothetical protein [Paenibacillus barcinonensis]PYE51632.1 hypothetical protein DFQ00_102427 [Paenibacillus barcinonensis]QKS55994.1 hypothetical protein HUB98_06320 [Paenibacillus barcinonensis]
MIDQIVTCPCCKHKFPTNDLMHPVPKVDENNIDLIKEISKTFNIELAEGGDKKENGNN